MSTIYECDESEIEVGDDGCNISAWALNTIPSHEVFLVNFLNDITFN